jgi:threonine dehydrogenase-like Zn-dependent dehydrogenase
MRATCWTGTQSVAVETVPDPQILNRRDAILKITSTAICGSDLHLYNGFIPTMRRGDILGHEFMGDRVVVPFPIACGVCGACERGLTSLCENSNPNAGIAEKLMGHSPAGLFGFPHMLGGFAGGQAEYARVPFADVGPLKVDDMPDEQVLFLSDIFPTGYMGADMAEVGPGDVVAVWGAGPVGQFAVASAFLLGADRVIVIDRFDDRLELARRHTDAETLNYERVSVPEALKEMTGGRGPDKCIDAVGMEGHHASTAMHAYDRVKQATMLETERPHALREAITSCANGGIVSVIGVYAGLTDKFPMGSIMNRYLTLRAGQCHVHRYMPTLLEHIRNGDIDPGFVITHRMALEDAPEGYRKFLAKEDRCEKVVLTP